MPVARDRFEGGNAGSGAWRNRATLATARRPRHPAVRLAGRGWLGAAGRGMIAP